MRARIPHHRHFSTVLPRMLATALGVAVATVSLGFGLLIAAVGAVAGLIGLVVFTIARHRFPPVARPDVDNDKPGGNTIEGEYRVIK